MSSNPTRLGPYTSGEIPPPLVVTFTDSAGAAVNLTGYTAKFVISKPDATIVTQNATVTTPLSGQVTYTWVAADFTQSGDYRAECWVGNLTNRYASVLFVYYTRAAIAVPAI